MKYSHLTNEDLILEAQYQGKPYESALVYEIQKRGFFDRLRAIEEADRLEEQVK